MRLICRICTVSTVLLQVLLLLLLLFLKHPFIFKAADENHILYFLHFQGTIACLFCFKGVLFTNKHTASIMQVFLSASLFHFMWWT